MKQLLLFVPLVLVACGIQTSPGNGEKIGQIVRISKIGMIYKTWEAEIIRGGLSSGSGTAGTQPFYFTIESDEMANRAQQYMRDQTEVLLEYRQEGIFRLTRTEKESYGSFATAITPIKSAK